MQSWRPLCPFLLVVGLVVLTVAAAVFGIVNAPTLYWPPIPPNNPSAQSQLLGAVERTISAPSFTWSIPRSQGLAETLIYNAPNRIHDYRGSQSATESYGAATTYYFRASDYYGTDSRSTSWVKMHDPDGYSDARVYALKFLNALSKAQNVMGHDGLYLAYSVEANDPNAAGEIGDVFVVRVAHGVVRSINVTVTGLFPRFSSHLYTGHERVSFSDVGTSPLIVLPPAKTVVGEAPPCGPATSGVTFCPA